MGFIFSRHYFFIFFFWTAIGHHLKTETQQLIDIFAKSPSTWRGMLFLVLFALVLSPFIEQRRIPFSGWFRNIPVSDFDSLQTELGSALGSPHGNIKKVDTGIYHGWHEHAVTVAVGSPTSIVCVFPKESGVHPAFCDTNPFWTPDLRYYPWYSQYDEKFLRSVFPQIARDKYPPAGVVADKWQENSYVWSWIGGVEDDCANPQGPYYIRYSDNGVISGPIGYSPAHTEGQLIAIFTNGPQRGQLMGRTSSLPAPPRRRRSNGWRLASDH